MTKEESIQIIESLFPTDSIYEDTNKVGKSLLDLAMLQSGFTWRDLPDNVLERYARLCEDKEQRQYKKSSRIN